MRFDYKIWSNNKIKIFNLLVWSHSKVFSSAHHLITEDSKYICSFFKCAHVLIRMLS